MQRVLAGKNPMTLNHLLRSAGPTLSKSTGFPSSKKAGSYPPDNLVVPLDESFRAAPDVYPWLLRFAYGIEK